MKKNNCCQLIRITGALVGRSPFSIPSILFNLLLPMTVRWHEASEVLIRKSDFLQSYFIIRPTEMTSKNDNHENINVTDNIELLTGDNDYQSKNWKTSKGSSISIDDVAGILLSLIETNDINSCSNKKTVMCCSKSAPNKRSENEIDDDFILFKEWILMKIRNIHNDWIG